VVSQRQTVLGLVAHPEDTPAARVDDGQSLLGLLELDRGGVEDEVAGRCARLTVDRQGPYGDGNVPGLADRRLESIRNGAIGEGLLVEGVALQGDQRMPTLEDERVHDVAHRRATGLF
jgi:hypothetical protein